MPMGREVWVAGVAIGSLLLIEPKETATPILSSCDQSNGFHLLLLQRKTLTL